MQSAIDRVGGEHPAEEQDFRHQKHPHAQTSGIALLLDVLKLVGESLRMRAVSGEVSHERPRMNSCKRLRSRSELSRSSRSEAETAWSTPAPWRPTGSGPPADRSAWTT